MSMRLKEINKHYIYEICDAEFSEISIPFSFAMYSEIREGIIRCILATDMARHNEILTQFQDIISTFDYSNEAHINSVSF